MAATHWKWLLLIRLDDGAWYAPSRTRSDKQRDEWLAKGGKRERRVIPYEAKRYHKVVEAKATLPPRKPKKAKPKEPRRASAKKPSQPKAKRTGKAKAPRKRHDADADRKAAKKAKKPATRPKKVKPAKGAPKAKRATKKLRELIKPRRPLKQAKFRGMVEVYAEEVAQAFKKMLHAAKEHFGGSSFVFHNRNHTVDGLLKIPVEHGQDMVRFVLQLEHFFQDWHMRAGTWLSSGIIFPQSRTTPDSYDRWQSLLQVLAYPQRWFDRHENFATLRKMIKNMAKRRRRKAQFVILKLHWNLDDIKPTREEMTSK